MPTIYEMPGENDEDDDDSCTDDDDCFDDDDEFVGDYNTETTTSSDDGILRCSENQETRTDNWYISSYWCDMMWEK